MNESENKDFINIVKKIRWVAVVISIILLIGSSGKLDNSILVLFLVINIGTIIVGRDYKKNN